ncbi:transposase [Vibrio scophthalmi]|uniref:transposase n=1 Tax=Vibrio scophthalmi TaxID=45658 RepID=UPI003B520A56
MKKRYTEEQIIKAIKQHEAGAKVDDICRDMGISSGTFYNWRSKYAGLCQRQFKTDPLIDVIAEVKLTHPCN